MPDINWNGDAESAPFTSRLDDASGNLILAETDTGTGLFEWDGSAWQFRGPVEMNGEDVSGIGSLTATSGNFDSVSTDEATITGNGRQINTEHIDNAVDSASMSFDIPSDVSVFYIDYYIILNNEGEITMSFDGDSTSTNYNYANVSLPSLDKNFVTDSSEFLLAHAGGSSAVQGTLCLSSDPISENWDGVHQNFRGGRVSEINSYMDWGSRSSTSADIGSVQIDVEGGVLRSSVDAYSILNTV